MKTVAIENSTWNNIGDAFYQTSLTRLFEANFPQCRVVPLDGPIERAFRPTAGAPVLKQKLKANSFDLGLIQEADIYVLSGPILGFSFVKAYGDAIKRWASAGAKYCILSAHGTGHDAIEFLKQYPPVAISTRDQETFDAIADVQCPKLNGICAAYFVSRFARLSDAVASSPYITSSFYLEPEPKLSLVPGGDQLRDRLKLERYPRFKRGLIDRNKLAFKDHADAVGDYKIVRIHHDLSVRIPYFHFAYPNSFVSYNADSYLTLYKHTTGTITDRVHACVATLSFGKPAWYCGKTTRDGVLRVKGCVQSDNMWFSIDQSFIDEQMAILVEWIGKTIEL